MTELNDDITVSHHWKVYSEMPENRSTKFYEYKTIYPPEHGTITNATYNAPQIELIKFFINEEEQFLLMNKAYLEITAEIADSGAAGAFYDGARKVALQSCGAMFAEGSYYINDTLVERVQNLHRVQHLRNVIDYPQDCQVSTVTDQMFFPDTGAEGKTNNVRFTAVNTLVGGVLRTGEAKSIALPRNVTNNAAPHADGTVLKDVNLLGGTTAGEGADGNVLRLTTAYTDVDNFNNGFAIRKALTQAQAFTYRVPLSRIFGIHNDIKHVWRGTKHRIELRRFPQAMIGEQVYGDTADMNYGGGHTPVVVMKNCTLHIPFLKPSNQVFNVLEQAMVDRTLKSEAFEYWNCLGPYNQQGATGAYPATKNFSFSVTSLIEKPAKVFIGMIPTAHYNTVNQNNLRYCGEVTNGIPVSNIQIRFGSAFYYPEQRFKIDAPSKSYLRLWDEWLRITDTDDSFNSGTAVSYDAFLKLFCFYSFDLRESLEDNVFSQGNSKDLIVEADVGQVLGAAPGTFELFIFIVSERNLILDIANKKMLVQVL